MARFSLAEAESLMRVFVVVAVLSAIGVLAGPAFIPTGIEGIYVLLN